MFTQIEKGIFMLLLLRGTRSLALMDSSIVLLGLNEEVRERPL